MGRADTGHAARLDNWDRAIARIIMPGAIWPKAAKPKSGI
jgi:hypothetical protein